MAGPSILALSDALCGTTHESVPRATLNRAEDCILDAIGAALGGRHMRSTSAVEATMSARAGAGRATVWFSERSCDPISAATINAMAATALDVDDGHRQAAGHPGAAVVASALAAAEHMGSSMSDMLAATVVGYEAAVRVALARRPEHHTSTVSGRWSGVGAAAVLGRLNGLPVEIMAQALLIAEQHAPRAASAKHHGFAGSDVKEAIAWSVHTGLYAVELARAGFTGYPLTFDQDVLYDPDVLCRDLDRFDAIDGLFFKPYACCRWIHSAIDGLLRIMADNGLEADGIDSVTVRTFDQAVGLGNHIAPENEPQAQFSIPFCLGAVAVRGASSLIPMDPALLEDKQVCDFARRVSVLPDTGMNEQFPVKAPAIVEIMAAGKALRTCVDAAFGDPSNPMRRGDLQEKFRRLARGRIAKDREDRLIAALDRIEESASKPVRRVLADLHGT